MKNFCTNCKARDSCTQLCPAAEAYVNKNYTRLREKRMSDFGINIEEIVINEIETILPLNTEDWRYLIKITQLTKLQKKYIYLYYFKYLSQQKIAIKYNTSRQNVRSIILRGTNKIVKSILNF